MNHGARRRRRAPKNVFEGFERTVAFGYTWATPQGMSLAKRRRLADLQPMDVRPSSSDPWGTARAAAWERRHRAWMREAQHLGPVLVPTGDVKRRYHPLHTAHRSLFRTFAALDYTNLDALRTFASEYGVLGLPTPHAEPREVARRQHPHYRESHLAWAMEIMAMREAVELASRDMVQRPVLDKAGHPTSASFVPLRRVRWLANRHTAHSELGFDPVTKRPTWLHQPMGLIGALWLQFGLVSFATGVEFFKCKQCGHPFEVSPDAAPRHRKFCTDACKLKNARARQRAVADLAAQGQRLNAIARATATPEATVRKWLGQTPAR